MQYSDQTDHDNKLNYRQQSDLDMSRNEQEMQVILRGNFFAQVIFVPLWASMEWGKSYNFTRPMICVLCKDSPLTEN